MASAQRKTLEEYLALEYPFEVKVDPAGGYVVLFPDLPGCFTEAETLDELPAMVAEARELWLETAYEQGMEIPLPTAQEECSGKMLLRVPKSLHRQLLDRAAREDVSLNHYASSLLARGDAQAAVERRLDAMEQRLDVLVDRLQRYSVNAPQPGEALELTLMYSSREQDRYPVAA